MRRLPNRRAAGGGGAPVVELAGLAEITFANGPASATGVPKPAAPSMNRPKNHATRIARMLLQI